MQEPQKSSGKLENIKNLKELVPSALELTARTREVRGNLDAVVARLRAARLEIITKREEAIRREQKEKQFEELKKQRNDERMAAERIIDNKAEMLARHVKEQKQSPQKTDDASNNENQKREAVLERPRADEQTLSSHEQPSSQSSHRTTYGNRPQNQFGGQRAYESRTQNRNYQSGDFARSTNNNNFQRYPNDRQFGRSPQQSGAQRGTQGGTYNRDVRNNGTRTWTPSQAQTAGGRSMGIARNGGGSGGYQGAGAQRPFQRAGGAPYGQVRAPGTFNNRPGMGANRFGAGGASKVSGLPKPTERFVPKPNTFDNRKKTRNHNDSDKPIMDRRSLLRRGIIEEQDIEERMLTRVFRTKKAKENSSAPKKPKSEVIIINTNTLTVKTLSEKIGKTAAEIIKQLMVLGNMCTINSTIDFEVAELVAAEFGIVIELQATQTFEEKMSSHHKQGADDEETLQSRPPVVTVMGHVDHGKTSLLDTIRKTNVVARESGGITQHIDAYQVAVGSRKITFIDTPGHAAFEKMRARGARITDIAILIVAADDGVMPQTVEAIKHIQSQELPMIVAINKMDKKEANPDKVLQQLLEYNVVPEAWGGNTIVCEISAVMGTGIDKLLEMILLVADVNNYRANYAKEAQGAILDARLDKSRGPLVTMLVSSGTLKIGDTLLAGTTYGKVRGLVDENGKKLKKATPGMPVVVLGFSDVPKAGDAIYVVDEKLTKQVVSERRAKEKITKTESRLGSVDFDPFARMTEGDKKTLNVIVKGDVSGSVEAIIQSIKNITSDEVTVSVISSGVGSVNDNDVNLADVTGALLLAFNTRVAPTAKVLAKKLKVDIKNFTVIYEMFDFVTYEMVKLFSPKFTEKYFGKAEVRALFKSSAIGTIAGCMVIDGKVIKGHECKLIRGSDMIGTYKLESLKIKTDDAREVSKGFECGIKLQACEEVRVGDIIECVGQEQLPIIFGGKKYEF